MNISNIFLFLLLAGFARAGSAQSFTAMTYNLRFDNPGDGANRWDNRKDQLLAQLQFHDPDFLGIQEGLRHQVAFLDEGLPDHRFVGVGRDDGDTLGEYSALFYRADRFELLDQGTFWLSDRPDEISVGWDASMERICSWGHFRDRESGRPIWVFNTHFDHIGEQARRESAALILERIRKMALSGGEPALLTGDLNALPDSPPIQLLSGTLEDARLASRLPAYGPEGTWNAFNPELEIERRIDYVFTSSDLRVRKYAVLSPLIDGRFLSDHFPVLAILEW